MDAPSPPGQYPLPPRLLFLRRSIGEDASGGTHKPHTQDFVRTLFTFTFLPRPRDCVLRRAPPERQPAPWLAPVPQRRASRDRPDHTGGANPPQQLRPRTGHSPLSRESPRRPSRSERGQGSPAAAALGQRQDTSATALPKKAVRTCHLWRDAPLPADCLPCLVAAHRVRRTDHRQQASRPRHPSSRGKVSARVSLLWLVVPKPAVRRPCLRPGCR